MATFKSLLNKDGTYNLVIMNMKKGEVSRLVNGIYSSLSKSDNDTFSEDKHNKDLITGTLEFNFK